MSNITASVALESSATTLPDGTYTGLWSAYTVHIPALDHHREGQLRAELTTVDGCRSLDGVPVTVTVASGQAVVEE